MWQLGSRLGVCLTRGTGVRRSGHESACYAHGRRHDRATGCGPSLGRLAAKSYSLWDHLLHSAYSHVGDATLGVLSLRRQGVRPVLYSSSESDEGGTSWCGLGSLSVVTAYGCCCNRAVVGSSSVGHLNAINIAHTFQQSQHRYAMLIDLNSW